MIPNLNFRQVKMKGFLKKIWVFSGSNRVLCKACCQDLQNFKVLASPPHLNYTLSSMCPKNKFLGWLDVWCSVKKQRFMLLAVWTRPRGDRARPRVQVPVMIIKEKKQKPRHGGVSGEHAPCPVTWTGHFSAGCSARGRLGWARPMLNLL